MPNPSRRRWFQFSMRTMFVVVTLLAIPMGWVTWEWSFVQERNAIKERLEGGRLASFMLWDDMSRRKGWFRPDRSIVGFRPYLRELLFDDPPVYDIMVEYEHYDRELTLIESHFPESGLVEGTLRQDEVFGEYWESTGESRRFRKCLELKH
jgi:hypothetical protein